MRRFISIFVRASVGLAWLAPVASADQFYSQTNLASDVPGLAPNVDANLKNPWGISSSTTSPFWVSDQVTGVSTLYNGAGVPQSLVVTIPGGGPTGQVFNGTSDFLLAVGGKATFLFSTLGGSIVGWNGGSGTTGQVAATVPGAVFTGLTMANNGSGNFLYAADTRGGAIDVFDKNFAPVTLSGHFTDPGVPAGLTPYNVQAIGNSIYVTYEARGVNAGVVSQFDLNGNLIREIGSSAHGAPLDEPWGVVMAPATFGQFGGDLLVGNKGDGHINAFDPTTGAFLGQLLDGSGHPIANTGLWGLEFGNAAAGTDPTALYFVAGINGEADGLFGKINAVPEPSTVALLVLGGLGLVGLRRRLPRRA